MSDKYQSFTQSAIGKILVKNLGLPNPAKLERYASGAPLVKGTVLVGGRGRLAESLTGLLGELDITATDTAATGARFKGLVFDATGLTSTADLVALQEFFTPVMRSLENNPRVVVIGTPPEQLEGRERVAQRALEGFTRSLGKEIGKGGTVQLVYVAEGFESSLLSTLAFLLSPKSAYVSGQVVRIGTKNASPAAEQVDPKKPLTGKVALVTGAARGIGEEIAKVLQRDGATVVGLDIPPSEDDLKKVTPDYITADITAEDAPATIAAYLQEKFGGVDIVVHNAGVTLDKKLANQKPDRFGKVLEINITAPERITAELLEQKLIRPNGRIIGVSSIAGIAGNLGQTSYGASKAAVIGFVDSLAEELPDGITVNAVAPGFIITQMTAAVPFATREVGQRLNAMSQGGLPVDVAETIAWYASPASTAVNGNVVRVCGQMMLGA
ncbi:3-oxoacyl-[acyl-carrier protein] reductase [Nocardioides luteus]|uniref:3-oxoacyl-ACP reductase n=1 Tax=Nocardioides luteus TaxID=1844 RepID=A0ABQ5T1W7_9ACTN|nr:3-oxoacyl-ACP reductase [Nocardioides luteus]MDR7310741.1 3-oxoacyl-[acyl-carrier protein] reductase [Nocardioides luteus]GGR40910.1 3-oxoacyl-ACP reductase [Nocardioides luteus]GLJ69479.1 3-oxoacyl-ACP reductase [Nocardioides luteus]